MAVRLRAHLDNVQLRQQVAVRQRHLVSIQELALGDLDVVDAVVINLIGERRAQILIQLQQRLQQPPLQSPNYRQTVTF